MKPHELLISAIALVAGVLLALPGDILAQAAQSAGKFTAVVPHVNLVRASQQMPAIVSEPVFWGDIVVTGRLARARVSLDDGSVLNVGPDANLTVMKHDAAAQQTEIELNYGRMRARVVRLAKPGASFKVRTPNAVAGVVGTDFALACESTSNFVCKIYVFEGSVNFCDLAGHCLAITSGQVSSIEEQNQPAPPSVASQAEVQAINKTTNVSPGAGTAAGGGTGAGGAGAGGGAGAAASTAGIVASHGLLIVAGAVAAVVAPAVAIRTGSKTPTCPSASPTTAGCTRIVTGAPGRINGQRP